MSVTSQVTPSDELPDGVYINESGWPILYYRWIGRPGDDSLKNYFEYTEGVMQRPGRRLVIVDARGAQMFTRELIQRQGAWLKKYRERIAEQTVGVAFVFSSGIMRFTLSGIFLIQPLPHPYFVCATPAEAYAWAHKMFLEEGIMVPRVPH